MGFLSVVHSDRGIKKNTNQDSVLIKEASTDYGDVMLAVVCDGMGGLAKGEVASAALIKAFSMWFEVQFPELLYRRRTADGINRMELENEINKLILDVNQRIADHGKISHIAMGTTAAVLLMAEGKYYTMNVGDSRVYKIDGQGMTQLTKDQTFVQKEIDAGRMTPDEARVHPQRNVLLQCVGASEVIIPEYRGQGAVPDGEVGGADGVDGHIAVVVPAHHGAVGLGGDPRGGGPVLALADHNLLTPARGGARPGKELVLLAVKAVVGHIEVAVAALGRAGPVGLAHRGHGLGRAGAGLGQGAQHGGRAALVLLRPDDVQLALPGEQAGEEQGLA